MFNVKLMPLETTWTPHCWGRNVLWCGSDSKVIQMRVTKWCAVIDRRKMLSALRGFFQNVKSNLAE